MNLDIQSFFKGPLNGNFYREIATGGQKGFIENFQQKQPYISWQIFPASLSNHRTITINREDNFLVRF